MIGQALKIRPIISCNKQGIYYTVSLIRGLKKGKQKLLSEMVKFCKGHVFTSVHGSASAVPQFVHARRRAADEVRERMAFAQLRRR